MIQIHKRQTVKAAKPGPTPFLWGLIALAAVIIIASIAIIARQNANEAALKLARQPLNDAIEYALTVARQTATAVGTDADAASTRTKIEEILANKDVNSRADMTQALIGELLALAKGNQSAIDELNGAKNRVHIATRNYANTQSGGN